MASSRQRKYQKVDDPEANVKFTNFLIDLGRFKKVDMYDPDAVRTRIYDFFELCKEHQIKPGVAALSQALGYDRKTLWRIRNHYQSGVPEESRDLVISAWNGLEVLWEAYMQGGNINPIAGIFLAKNNFGYSNQVEHVHVIQETKAPDIAALEAKYAELPDVEEVPKLPGDSK